MNDAMPDRDLILRRLSLPAKLQGQWQDYTSKRFGRWMWWGRVILSLIALWDFGLNVSLGNISSYHFYFEMAFFGLAICFVNLSLSIRRLLLSIEEALLKVDVNESTSKVRGKIYDVP